MTGPEWIGDLIARCDGVDEQDGSPFRILVTGSRDFGDYLAMQHALMDVIQTRPDHTGAVLVHGGAPGADTIAGQIWHEWRAHGMRLAPAEVHPADWDRYGRAAGPRRNRKMVALGADVCLAFPIGVSRGTRGCVALCERAGIPVVVHEAEHAVGTTRGPA